MWPARRAPGWSRTSPWRSPRPPPAAAPTPSGRTYTFRLRPGIRYSTGTLVRPRDVTHSFERLFQLGGAGAPYYQAISGAATCRKAPARCDLSRGIVGGDRGGAGAF